MTERKPKPGDWRMTVEVVASGQARRYADTVQQYRVLFEWCSWIRKGPVQTTPPNDSYEPVEWDQSVVEKHLRAIYGWEDNGDWASPKLDFLRKVAPGTWEFKVRETYTD